MISNDLRIDELHDRIVDGIRLYFNRCGAQKAIIGLSGGLDSAVVATLAVRALGAANIHGFLMPSEFSTLHSIQDALDLADNLDIEYNIIPISPIYNKFIKELQPVYGSHNKWNVAEEHLQARIRGTLLMAYANKFGALLINTTNKSELSVGYGTLYGDLAGALMVLGDLYKSEVYELAQYINRDDVVIPVSSITKAPSDELRRDQKDNDYLPDYNILDRILYALNEAGKSGDEIVALGYSRSDVDKIIKLWERSGYKLLQAPPVLNVSKKPILSKEKWVL